MPEAAVATGADAARDGSWSRRRVWGTVAVLVAVGGVTAAVLGARSVSNDNADESARAFERSSNEVASTLQQAIQRDQALIEGTAAFVTVNPDATNADFADWGDALRWRARYPEVRGFGLAVPVPAAELDEFIAKTKADPIDPTAPDDRYRIVPPGDRSEYCLASLGQYRASFATGTPAGSDYCAGVSGIPFRVARDTGRSLYFPIELGDTRGLAITTPAYEGGRVPATIAQRRQRLVGWLGTVVAQGRLLDRALANQPEMAATLRFRADDNSATFTSGEAPEDGRSLTVHLNSGWTLETVGSTASGAIWSDREAVALLLTGVALSVLLGVLVFILGTGRARARHLVGERTAELRHQALHDGLTGLPNRTLIVDRTEQLLARNRRNGTAPAALFVDLDEFKDINDTLGHGMGDQLLIAVANRLKGALRDADTIGRLGGDEFVVLIDGGDFVSGPELVAQRLMDVMRQPFELEGAPTPIVVNPSIGIAVGDRETPGELLRDADVALYEAKAAGKHRYAVFDREMETDLSHRIQLGFDLRSALEEGQFRIAYQPIYNLDDLTVVGVEALLRWEHPTEGTIQPREFVPVLERSGQIRDVGRWVLHQACAQMVAWHSRGDTVDLSVNVSGRQLDDDTIVDDIKAALSETGLDPRKLIVEVTETALMRGVEATARRLQAIKDLGVRIAVDDFGTGYSSLAHLQRFPVDCIKIDRAFTSAISTSPESDALVHTLVQLGRDLGLTTLAEGIERPGQVDHLRGEHVQEGQGFLLSRPLDPETLEAQVLAPLRPMTESRGRR